MAWTGLRTLRRMSFKTIVKRLLTPERRITEVHEAITEHLVLMADPVMAKIQLHLAKAMLELDAAIQLAQDEMRKESKT